VWNSRSLIAGGDGPRAAFFGTREIPQIQSNAEALVLLGRIDEASFFAYEIESVEPPQWSNGARFEDLRLIASLLPPDEAGLLGYARRWFVAAKTSLLRKLRDQDAVRKGRPRARLHQSRVSP